MKSLNNDSRLLFGFIAYPGRTPNIETKFVFAVSLLNKIADTIRNTKEGTTIISWMASNCNPSWVNSDRGIFVEKLKTFLEVDVYGRCGPLEVDLPILNSVLWVQTLII